MHLATYGQANSNQCDITWWMKHSQLFFYWVPTCFLTLYCNPCFHFELKHVCNILLLMFQLAVVASYIYQLCSYYSYYPIKYVYGLCYVNLAWLDSITHIRRLLQGIIDLHKKGYDHASVELQYLPMFKSLKINFVNLVI